MKKKFINGLLMAALFLGFTGSMVSCKDYDDEKVGDLSGVLADKEAELKDALAAQKKALEDKIADLQSQIDACKKTCSDFQTWAKAEFDKYLTLIAFNEFKSDLEKKLAKFYTKDEIDAKFTSFAANYYTKTEIDNMFQQLNNYYSKDEVYTKDEIDALLNSTLTASYYTKEDVDNLLNEIKSLLDAQAIAETIVKLLNEGNTTLINAFNNWFVNNPVIEEYLKTGKGSEIINEHITNALITVNQAIADVKAISDEALRLAKENQQRIVTLEGNVQTLDEKFKTLDENFQKLQGDVEKLQGDVENIQGNIENIQGDITNIKGSITGLESRTTALETIAEDLKGRVVKLESLTKDLNDKIISLGEKLDEVSETATAALANSLANTILIAMLDEAYDLLDGRVENLEDGLDALKEKIYNDSLAADALHREMLETISGLVSAVNNAVTLGDVEVYINNSITELNISGQLEELKSEIEILIDEKLNVQTQALQKLTETFENVMAKFITGIEINGTDCPLFGEFSLPIDVRSNILLAYYGTLDDYGYEFPTDRPAYNALEDGLTITEEDIAMIGNLKDVEGYKTEKNTTIISMDGAVGNAGKLYMTVNPTNRNFTGTEFELINSRNEKSAVELADLAKSDHLLSFGYTRGGVNEESANGFYEAKATITKEALSNERIKPDFKTDDITTLFKQFRDNKAIDLTLLVNTIYKNVSRILEANAVKATWEDELGSRSVISQYSIAAAAAKPLSFAFAKDVTSEVFPGFSYIEKFVNKLVDKISAQLPDFNYEIIDAELVELYPNVVYPSDVFAEFNVVVRNLSTNKTKTLHIIFDMAEWTYLFPDNDVTLDNIQEFINAVIDYVVELNDINTGSLMDDAKNSILNTIIDLVKSRPHLANFLAQPNKLLQPVLLVVTNQSYSRLSQISGYPAHVNKANFVLCPTTYTGEIIAPAYKKFVAVTNVSKGGVSAKGGDATCKSILDKANAQKGMKKVFFGGIHADTHINFSAEAGYTYELLYSALDYSGKVVTKKFYVTVSE
jgi:TolA-binding protein